MKNNFSDDIFFTLIRSKAWDGTPLFFRILSSGVISLRMFEEFTAASFLLEALAHEADMVLHVLNRIGLVVDAARAHHGREGALQLPGLGQPIDEVRWVFEVADIAEGWSFVNLTVLYDLIAHGLHILLFEAWHFHLIYLVDGLSFASLIDQPRFLYDFKGSAILDEVEEATILVEPRDKLSTSSLIDRELSIDLDLGKLQGLDWHGLCDVGQGDDGGEECECAHL